jgi:hypothetical protein
VALFQTQLDAISPLVSRGTVAVPQRLALEQNVMQLETAQLDIEMAILKARQEEERSVCSRFSRSACSLRSSTGCRPSMPMMLSSSSDKVAGARGPRQTDELTRTPSELSR